METKPKPYRCTTNCLVATSPCASRAPDHHITCYSLWLSPSCDYSWGLVTGPCVCGLCSLRFYCWVILNLMMFGWFPKLRRGWQQPLYGVHWRTVTVCLSSCIWESFGPSWQQVNAGEACLAVVKTRPRWSVKRGQYVFKEILFSFYLLIP